MIINEEMFSYNSDTFTIESKYNDFNSINEIYEKLKEIVGFEEDKIIKYNCTSGKKFLLYHSMDDILLIEELKE